MLEKQILRLVNAGPAPVIEELGQDFGLGNARRVKIARRQRDLGTFAFSRIEGRNAPVISRHISNLFRSTVRAPFLSRDGQVAGYHDRSAFSTPWMPIDEQRPPAGRMKLVQYQSCFAAAHDCSDERPEFALWTKPAYGLSSGKPAFHFTPLPPEGVVGGDILHDDRPLPLHHTGWDVLDKLLGSMAEQLTPPAPEMSGPNLYLVH